MIDTECCLSLFLNEVLLNLKSQSDCYNNQDFELHVCYNCSRKEQLIIFWSRGAQPLPGLAVAGCCLCVAAAARSASLMTLWVAAVQPERLLVSEVNPSGLALLDIGGGGGST
jgi:hypothetical protein